MSSPQEPSQPGHAGPGQQQLPPYPQQAPAGNPHQPPAGNPQQPFFAQHPEPGPFGLPGQPPARNRRKLWIVLATVGGVLLLVILGVVILINVVGSATNQARGLADGFTRLVIAGESSKAYDDYLDPALQEQLSKEDFMSGVGSLEMDEGCKPAYNDVKVSTENGIKTADIVGLIACDGKEVDLAYRFEGTDDVKMTNIKLRPAP
ncbi:hypothetical protein [Pseudarthrobacter sp. NamE5]|uniref:hypothetical protein n=1 Tax=Pseudarthrobacter sp. NamE5 TaxID=2576839 RepID=UPI00110A61A7|nr:hypothetical protein [Pseudarthrobacter sp. NamE5]TLM85298.1 hypothetical protein FDW84_09690 [Pseudarthrobacter sp. NamE5]